MRTTEARLVTGVMVAIALAALGSAVESCVTIDPGPNPSTPLDDFNANYFYCYVEPKLIFGKNCGDDGSHGCHYSDKIPYMALSAHAPVNCAGGGTPVDMTEVGTGTPASGNLAAVSANMNADYTIAGIYVYPTQLVMGHPKKVFDPNDPVVKYIATWAQE